MRYLIYVGAISLGLFVGRIKGTDAVATLLLVSGVLLIVYGVLLR